MGFAKPIEQYLFSNLLIRIHVFMYLKDIIRVGDEMKTVHEWIKETDADKLADAYFYEYPIEYERYINSEKTVSEIKDCKV